MSEKDIVSNTQRLVSSEGSGASRTATPEDIVRSQEIATRESGTGGISPEIAAAILTMDVLREEERNPEGVIVERYISVGDSNSSIPGTPHRDPNGDLMS